MTSTLLDRLRDAPALRAVAGEPAVWVVGGAVRDLRLGRTPRELDLVVVGDAVAVARRAAARIGGEVVVHERFGTATVRAAELGFDLATARRETYPRPGALPDVEPADAIEADLERRDFTVNTMAVGLADGRLAAVSGAEEDLAAGRLRVLHDDSFRDDPTRLLRMARYAARLGFAVEPRTAGLARAAVAGGALGTVSGERLGAELRLLAREPQPAALEALARFGLGAALLPGYAVDAGWTARALALAPQDARADLVALGSALAAGAAAPDAPTPELAARLAGLGLPADERRVLLACSTLPSVRAALAAAGAPSAVRHVLRAAPVEVAVLAAAAGDDGARGWLDHWRHARPALTGHDLLAAGLAGPAVGAGLEAATEALLDGRAPDREAQLAAALAAGAIRPPRSRG